LSGLVEGIKVDYKRTSQTLAVPNGRFLVFRLVLKLESIIYDTLLSVISRFKRRAIWNLMVVELVRADTLEAKKRVVHYCQKLKFLKKREQYAVSSQLINVTCRRIKCM
jgi:hypothetical protein